MQDETPIQKFILYRGMASNVKSWLCKSNMMEYLFTTSIIIIILSPSNSIIREWTISRSNGGSNSSCSSISGNSSSTEMDKV